jgi:hypothetical protein
MGRILDLPCPSVFGDLRIPGDMSGLHRTDSIRSPRTRVQLILPSQPKNDHWKIADSMVESTCSSLPISSKHTSSVTPNAFFCRSAKRGPEMAIWIGFKLSKPLIVVRRLICAYRKLHLGIFNRMQHCYILIAWLARPPSEQDMASSCRRP